MQYDPGLVYTLILAGQAVMQGGGAGGGVQAPAAPMAQAPSGMAPPPPAAAAAPGGMPMMAKGGYLPPEASPTGDNTGRADDIQIRVSGGEYVIPQNVVERKGTEFFDKMIGKDTATA
jgi:hypothetical protein